MSKFLVTGGAGFIGSHLVERLVREEHRVRVLDDLSTGKQENLKAVAANIEFIRGDAADAQIVASAVRGVDGIFHLAALPSVPLSIKDPLRNQRSGEVAALTILDAAQRSGVKRVVYTSSAAIYGNSPVEVNDETQAPLPLNPYALSKLTGENYGRIFSQLYPGLDTASLRYFNVFGPRQDPTSPYSGVISIFLNCAKRKVAPTIFGDGRQTRDFVEVSNVVEANLLAMNSKEPLRGETFNVATGESVSLLEVWNHLSTLSGLKLSPQFEPARIGDIKYSRAAIGKIRSQLGYRPLVDWKQGLERIWQHFNEEP